MATSYTYSLLTNFRQGIQEQGVFLTIKANTSITTPVVSVVLVGLDAVITFSSALRQAEKTVLDTIVANYVPGAYTLTSDLTILSYNAAAGTNGGSITRNVWATRPLNTIEHGSEAVTLDTTTSRFHLAPGRYQVYGSAEVGDVGDHRIRVHNVTANATSILGINCTTSVRAIFSGIVVSTDFNHEWELQHIASRAVLTQGLGRAIALGGPEIFTMVHIQPL